jgi:hypothetical protein
MSVPCSTPDWKKDLPPIPRWDIVAIERNVSTLFKVIIEKSPGSVIDEDKREVIAEIVSTHFALEDPLAQLAVLETLIPYTGKMLEQRVVHQMARQICVNIDDISKGIPVQRLTGIADPQWVPMEIVEYAIKKDGKTTLLTLFLQILAGKYCGFRVERVFPINYTYVMSRELGYSWKRRYDSPRDLIGLRFAAWVETSTITDIQFEHYWLTTSMKTHNMNLIKKNKPLEKDDDA